MVLKCFLLLNVGCSYSNMWWRDSLARSFAINQDHTLRVLTEKHFDVDVVKPTPARYINLPALRNGEVLEDGYYHLNIQTSAKMFVGFMWVKGNSVVWWGQDNGDSVYAGMAGDHDACLSMLNPSILEWHHAATYSDQFQSAETFRDIIRI